MCMCRACNMYVYMNISTSRVFGSQVTPTNHGLIKGIHILSLYIYYTHTYIHIDVLF